uniref:BZIP domain-containing protein n=1 Tax=Anisakis simplex TaxID=6269 RepID=A0A0M3JSZ8_ANISI
LQGQNRQIVTALKQKRRTLKNRGYAFNCRIRRIQNQLQLEADNMMLRNQVRCLKQMLHSLQTRLAYYEPSFASVNDVHSEAITSSYPQSYKY